jgi:hypothetical protein
VSGLPASLPTDGRALQSNFWKMGESANYVMDDSRRYQIFSVVVGLEDRLCGLVVRVLGYRSGGPGSIPGTTRKKK